MSVFNDNETRSPALAEARDGASGWSDAGAHAGQLLRRLLLDVSARPVGAERGTFAIERRCGCSRSRPADVSVSTSRPGSRSVCGRRFLVLRSEDGRCELARGFTICRPAVTVSRRRVRHRGGDRQRSDDLRGGVDVIAMVNSSPVACWRRRVTLTRARAVRR